MTLEPGDPGIKDVTPWDAELPEPQVSCSRCGKVTPSSEAFAVRYEHEDGASFAFLVGPDCAEDLSP